MYEPDTLEFQAKLDDLFTKLNSTTDRKEAAGYFGDIQRILANDMVWSVPVGTMQKRIAFQSNIHGIENALWFTNNNYLGFAMEKVWIEPNS